MSNKKKAILGLGLVALAATAIVVTKKSRKYTTLTAEGGQEEKKEEDPTVMDKIKKAATKKAADVVIFVANHQEQIEAASTIIGIVGSAISVASAIREFKSGMDVEQKLNDICAHNDEFELVWNKYIDDLIERDKAIDEKLEQLLLATAKKVKK